MSSSRSVLLRGVSRKFCDAFVTGTLPPDELLSQFFHGSPQIIEHGPEGAQKRLPFVGTLFKGRRSEGVSSTGTCDDYFDLLGATLALHAHERSLPAENGYVVDPDAVYGDQGNGVVFVKAHARLSSVDTGRTWEEHFIFVLSGFDEVGKMGQLEIWADNLNAWSAVGDEEI